MQLEFADKVEGLADKMYIGNAISYRPKELLRSQTQRWFGYIEQMKKKAPPMAMTITVKRKRGRLKK